MAKKGSRPGKKARARSRADQENERRWWRDHLWMLVRWAITVCLVILFNKQMHKDEYVDLFTLVVVQFHVFIYLKQIYKTLRAAVHSAKNVTPFHAYNAFKLFLRALPEYDIWCYITKHFFLGNLIMITAPVEIRMLLLILAASLSFVCRREDEDEDEDEDKDKDEDKDEDEECPLRADPSEDNNNDNNSSNSAWGRYFKMPQMLLRWGFKLHEKMNFCGFNKKYPFCLVILALSCSILLFVDQIASILVAGARSAMEGFQAFKLFLLGRLPEFKIWFQSPFFESGIIILLSLLIMVVRQFLASRRGRRRQE